MRGVRPAASGKTASAVRMREPGGLEALGVSLLAGLVGGENSERGEGAARGVTAAGRSGSVTGEPTLETRASAPSASPLRRRLCTTARAEVTAMGYRRRPAELIELANRSATPAPYRAQCSAKALLTSGDFGSRLRAVCHAEHASSSSPRRSRTRPRSPW